MSTILELVQINKSEDKMTISYRGNFLRQLFDFSGRFRRHDSNNNEY